MSSDVLIRADHVSKKFCRSLKRSLWYGFCDLGADLNPFARRANGGAFPAPSDVGAHGAQNASVEEPVRYPPLRKGEFWAVRDVSFELKRGECLGLIGHNGAGKSTLLRMLTGLIKPDTGRIEMRGRVGSLIELGAGFNPILTGRENVYNRGAVLGLTRAEIDARFDAIVDFAEIGDFIDSPVQFYSSGMYVRLGFAVCAQMTPDVLLIDEVLAVGDVRFQFKCLNAMADMMRNAAVVFVSHAMPQVYRVSSEVMLMEKGGVAHHSKSVGDGIERYFRMSEGVRATVAGSGEAVVERLELEAGGKTVVGPEPLHVGWPADLTVRLDLRLASHIPAARILLVLWNQAMLPVADIVAPDGGAGCLIQQNASGHHSIRVRVPGLALNGGKHTLTVIVTAPDGGRIYCRHDNAGVLCVPVQSQSSTCFVLPAQWEAL